MAEVPGDEARPDSSPPASSGADGRRWFLRGVFTGGAAAPGAAAELLEQVYAGTLVVRGDQAMAPRDLLPLQMPDQPGARRARGRTGPPDASTSFRRRGPEITEIH